ncbi:methylmalonyl-CoA mutase family protein [Klenkia terrae]|uniref:methylmalonyl-CoA mutase subunit beta n=1 Tax=Klenkia terrae TaxID=1052259 RepID=UPI003614F4D9
MSHPTPDATTEPVAPPDELALAADFPQPTLDQWRDLVAGVLRKAGREDLPEPVEEALRSTVATGVSVRPLYTAADTADLPGTGAPGLPPFVRGSRVVRPAPAAADGQAATSTPAGWDVRQRHADPDVGTTRDAIGADLEHGVTSLWLVLGEGGVPVDALGEVLADVLLDLAPVTLQGGPAAAEAFLDLVAGHELAPGGNLGLDPLGVQAASGEEQDLSGLAGFARRAAEHGDLRTVVVDATVVHDAGATAVEELGCALSAGVAYLRALTEQGLSVAEAAQQLEFRFAATADQFTTIATLRAARRLWDRVGEAAGVPAQVRGMRQHAVTSSVMTTARDPWVNMLRTTVACFAAGVGGADAVTVQPFDAALGLPDAFARRIARNTQALLTEESHLGRVLDPAGGSWYVESLTDALAHAAWDWFTELERAGGYAAALASGLVRDRVAAAWADRSRRLATRRDPITGVSEFPNLAEKLPERRPAGRPSRRGPAGCRGCGPRRPSSSCATGPMHPVTGRRSTWRRSASPPRTPHGCRSRPTCSRPGASPRRPATGPRTSTGPRSPASAAPTATTPALRTWPPSCGRPVRNGSGWPESPTSPSTASTATCSPAATPSTS